MRGPFVSRHGMSLIEVVIALGISMLVLMGVTTMMTQMMKQNAYVQGKLDIVEGERALLDAYKNEPTCTSQLAKDSSNVARTIDLSGAVDSSTGLISGATVALNSIKLGPDSPKAFAAKDEIFNQGMGRVVVKDVSLVDVSPVNAAQGLYQGQIQISFVQGEGDMAYRPIRILQMFAVDLGSGTPSSRTITGCRTDGSADIGAKPGVPKMFARTVALGFYESGMVDMAIPKCYPDPTLASDPACPYSRTRRGEDYPFGGRAKKDADGNYIFPYPSYIPETATEVAVQGYPSEGTMNAILASGLSIPLAYSTSGLTYKTDGTILTSGDSTCVTFPGLCTNSGGSSFSPIVWVPYESSRALKVNGTGGVLDRNVGTIFMTGYK